MYRLKTLVGSFTPVANAAVKTLTQTGSERTCKSTLLKHLGERQFVRYYAAQVAAEPFLNGSSSAYVEEMYIAWQEDPSSVHKVSIVIKKNGCLLW